jgi:large subunit ribosomal protein L29
MKAKELRDITEQELNDKVLAFKKEIFNLRFKAALGQSENPMNIKLLRKDIARIKTILAEKKRLKKDKKEK